MELKEILKLTKKYRTHLLLSLLVGVLLGVGIYYLPEKYTSTGSFYITRTAQEPSQEYFTYEGYYSQQTAMAFTNTVVALLESVDIRKMTLENLQETVTEKSLRRLARNIDVVKTGPQVITLTVKRSTPDSAQQHWNAMAANLMLLVEGKNQTGDQKLQVIKISETPVTKPTYKSLALNLAAGALGMVAITLAYASLNEYSSGGKKKIWS